MLALLRDRGASFFGDLRGAAGARRRGRAQRDRIARRLGPRGVRRLCGLARARSRAPTPRRRRSTAARTSRAGGRRSRRPQDTRESRDAAVEAQAWTLLRRYGVVFRRLLAREALAAPWRELTRVYRRLEARGEIRGGRFVSGMAGEQYALPRAVERLREVRRGAADGRVLAIGTADPLNLVGIVTRGRADPRRGAQPPGLSRRCAARGPRRGLHPRAGADRSGDCRGRVARAQPATRGHGPPDARIARKPQLPASRFQLRRPGLTSHFSLI